MPPNGWENAEDCVAIAIICEDGSQNLTVVRTAVLLKTKPAFKPAFRLTAQI